MTMKASPRGRGGELSTSDSSLVQLHYPTTRHRWSSRQPATSTDDPTRPEPEPGWIEKLSDRGFHPADTGG